MRKTNLKYIAAAAVLAIAAGAGISSVNEAKIGADAGSSRVYVVSEASITKNSISTGTFFISGDVTADNGKAVFGNEKENSSLFQENLLFLAHSGFSV